MIATHNIKVNDRWYKAGEEIPEEKKAVQKVKEEVVPEVKEEPVPVEEPKEKQKEEPKPKTASRRKKISE